MGIVSKEDIERNRQLALMREYFGKRKMLLETRIAKFLKMYPYVNNGTNINMNLFKSVVTNATEEQQSAIYKAYLQEKKYWMSAYVLGNCNRDVHAHIVNTLAAMEKILTHIKLSSVTSYSSVRLNNYKTNASKNVATTSSTGNNWGKAGEKAVEYVLKWLPDPYCVIEKDCVGKYSDHVILLENPSFTDEVQEFDHLVIGPQGIFNIETKNYSGKVHIDRFGNWLRLKNGESEWVPEENPVQQLFRHRVMLESIVGKNIPIIDVICMAHPSLMLSGQENSNIPIVKKDLLADFIVNYRSAGLSIMDIKIIKNKISACKTSMNDVEGCC